jgi:hypothetical protein
MHSVKDLYMLPTLYGLQNIQYALNQGVTNFSVEGSATQFDRVISLFTMVVSGVDSSRREIM